MGEQTKNRRNIRVKLEGYIADIADGHFVYAGMVEDVSVTGLRLTELPGKFSVQGKKYTLVVSGEPVLDCYKLKVIPRWWKNDGTFLAAGFKILEAPTQWKEFVLKITIA